MSRRGGKVAVEENSRMNPRLTSEQLEAQRRFRCFFDEQVTPDADKFEEGRAIPDEVIARIGSAGYLGAGISRDFGGQGFDSIVCGLLFEEAGRASCSLLSLFAVHGMVAEALARWGSPTQKKKWLPALAAGRAIAAFGLSERSAGSDAAGIQTRAEVANGSFRLNGQKHWISFAPRADVYLVFARCGDEPVAILVERHVEGLSVSPVGEILSFRAARLGDLTFSDCVVPRENLIGRMGTGLSHIMNFCLEYGRYCIAWGSVGVAQACLEAASSHAANRQQFGKALIDHQMVQQMLTEMITNVRAARLLCCRAGCFRDEADPAMLAESAAAKYFASRTAAKASADALQILGASGLTGAHSVERHFRDARALEIIEGSTQVLQTLIARDCHQAT